MSVTLLFTVAIENVVHTQHNWISSAQGLNEKPVQ